MMKRCTREKKKRTSDGSESGLSTENCTRAE